MATLQGKKIRVESTIADGRLHEHYLAARGDRWVEVARNAGRTAGALSVVGDDGEVLPGIARNVSVENGVLTQEIDVGPHRVVRTLTLTRESAWVRVATRFEPVGSPELYALSDHFSAAFAPDWSYSPSVGGFNPDGQYKAPLILVQATRDAFGIVPDLRALSRPALARCQHALDLDVPGGPLLSVGYIPARMVSHCVYGPDPERTWTADTPIENRYYLLVTATAPPDEAYRQAVRFHWTGFGRAEQAYAADQQVGTDPRYRSLTLWDDWRREVWERETPESWLTAPLPDGATGGGVRTLRWGPGPSVYLSSWFNTLRTSYGMALYARRTGQAHLLELAQQTVELALKAPGHDGAFKCIAVPGEGERPTVWAAGDGCGASTPDGFLGYDMSWTGYWLLKWRAAGLPGGDGCLSRCRQLARFFLARQAANGMLPTRFDEDGVVQAETSLTVKAETGAVALFLLELYRQDPDKDYLGAALLGLMFLGLNVLPRRQWYDYETFWSCSPRDASYDARSGQWPANNLALTQAVAAHLLAHQLTGLRRFLQTGEALLDYLLLYQQCWTNPVLEDLSCPAMLLGGFTTQNSDAEWSDARQSQCGNILLDYYRATGKVEYLERGIAALRAQFPISPSENWAHGGYGGKAGVSSFHWGTGSGMAGIEMEEEFLRDAIVDVAAKRGVGVNGLNVTACRVRDDRIDLRVSSPFTWSRPAVIVFRHAEPERRYHLDVNGAHAGDYSGEDLEKGISVVPAESA